MPGARASASLSPEVKRIISNYENENAGVKGNLVRMLNTGKLAGTGKMVILPVDQGFEHGPARSFAVNPDAYDPHYHYQLAIETGCNAYAAPLGPLQAGADTFAGQIPTILKFNSSNSLDSAKNDHNQAVTASIKDALELGCSAVGFTIYPGSDQQFDMFEEVRDMIRQAKDVGLASVVWSYARGSGVTKEGETAMDVIAYAAHMACLLGAHIVKVKLPTEHIMQKEAQKAFDQAKIDVSSQTARVREVVRSCFNGRRIVVFSGGATKGEDSVFDDAKAIRDGGGNGSIIGRNAFQRPWNDSVALLDKIMDIYKN
ncbi:MAG: class I fructose-bisphosphate aldolase [Alphaproteobacteria bacterium]|nr:class I fructose-bisphosphate aldolase [Alphaproteobacteria bacterium]MBP7757622.1 class I fructose-bisphosphate aldolase [Alphaproteobacteria bacterium]MBP7761178.1 class I fructose-bisphosphate aldolase [Alphaproteobacteria bacterium]MBP7905139.1 class I fructose-bisphosphate aldolase [Alphaproteobacteria bacterium]